MPTPKKKRKYPPTPLWSMDSDEAIDEVIRRTTEAQGLPELIEDEAIAVEVAKVLADEALRKKRAAAKEEHESERARKLAPRHSTDEAKKATPKPKKKPKG